MSPERSEEAWRQLSDELQNFRELASYINPSPGEIPVLDGIEIAGLSLPLKENIGGDHVIYIDFNRRYDLDRRIARAEKKGRDKVAKKLERLQRRAGILLADVSGHRMTDALLGAMLHQAFLLGVHYELDRHGEITTRLFEHINTRFYRTTAFAKYFTMIYGEISEKGQFRFLSAGHQPPAVFSKEYRKLMRIGADRLISFPPVGLLPSSIDPDERVEPGMRGYKKRYQINEINLLASGDSLLLSTDGLVEHDQGCFFPDAVEQLLADCVDASAVELCERLRREMLDRSPPDDDVSVVFIRRTK